MAVEDSNDDSAWLMKSLAKLDEQIRATPADDFKKRYELSKLADEVRTVLRSDQASALEKAQAEWAKRAGNKGGHEQDVETLEALARGKFTPPGR